MKISVPDDCTCGQIGRAGRQCVPHGHKGFDDEQHWGSAEDCNICPWQVYPLIDALEQLANGELA